MRVTRVINGQRIEKRKRGLLTSGEAKRIEKEFNSELDEFEKNILNPNWQSLLSEYFPYYEQKVKYSTYYSAKKVLEKNTNDWKIKSLSSFSRGEIETHINSLYDSIESKKKMLKYLRQVFNFAIDRKYLSLNPCSGISFGKVPQKPSSAMDHDEITKLLRYTKSIGSDWHYIYFVVYSLGLRSGEGLALEWSSIDFKNKNAHVYKSYCSKKKEVKTTKNYQHRVVPINS